MSSDNPRLTITMTIDMHNRLYEIADKTGNSLVSVVRTALAKEIEEWDARRPRPYYRASPWTSGFPP